jgi:cytochrome c oxidase cbb3-type subunit III
MPIPIRFTLDLRFWPFAFCLCRELAFSATCEYPRHTVDVLRTAASTVLVLSLGCALMSQARHAAVFAQGQTTAASPASKPPPASKTPQSYPAEQIRAGESMFVSRCGFCHGRDAAGGESGPDLTRSVLVAEDVRGNKIGRVVRDGRPDKGMPPITLSDPDLSAIVAFVHDAKSKAESASGGRRSVDVADLQTGNAEAGKAYFNGAGGCAACHAVTGDFARVGARYQGLALLQRMLYPGSGRDAGPPPSRPTATVTTKTGQVVSGRVVYRDEFTISLVTADGWTSSWPLEAVTISGGDDPLHAHIQQLARYTDADMHNVFAYLQSLR